MNRQQAGPRLGFVSGRPPSSVIRVSILEMLFGSSFGSMLW